MTTAGTPSAPSPVDPEPADPLAGGRTAADPLPALVEPRLDAQSFAPGEDAPPDAASALDIIRAQRLAVRDRFEPDTRVLFGAWGAAWLVGNLVLFATARDAPGNTPAGWSFAIYFALLAAAIAVTIRHVVRRSAGLVGPSGTSGAMFGWAWTIGFIGIYLIMSGFIRAGVSPEIINLGWSSLSCFLVGVLYLAGGALWHSRVLYALGAWIVLVGGAATLAGLPGLFLVMGLAGGGGMLLGALVTHLTSRNER